MINDGITIERLSDYKKIKPFSIKLGKEQSGIDVFKSYFNDSKNKIRFNELLDIKDNEIVQKTISITLSNQEEMAILQFVFGVRRNKFNTDLLILGTNAQKRLNNLIKNKGIINKYINGVLNQEELFIIKNQPIFKEYQ